MARLIFLDIFLQKVWSIPNLFLIFAMLKKTIDIFIRREVVDAHEMGIFFIPRALLIHEYYIQPSAASPEIFTSLPSVSIDF